MVRVIKNASLLLGRDLSYVESGFIEIAKDGKITRAGAGNYSNKVPNNKLDGGNDGDGLSVFDSEGLLVMPGFINAHIHIGDSLGKDLLVDSGGMNERIHPVYGAKSTILRKSSPDHLKMIMRASIISMMKKGIVAFADFREGGPDGINLLRQAISILPIKCIVLGRIEYYFDLITNLKVARAKRSVKVTKARDKIKNSSTKIQKQQNEILKEIGLRLPPNALHQAANILKMSDGLGLSGANENTNAALHQYKQLLNGMNKELKSRTLAHENRKLLLAIHAAESEESVKFSNSITGKTEVARIMRYLNPDLIIHMTNATDADISLVAKKGAGVVICPRANGILGAGIPKVARMLERGCTIAIGTDNVMLNSPDMFKEMDYIWKASRATEKKFISARDILKMSTINAADILGLNSGCIEAGRSADLLFINKKNLELYPIHNPYASILHRAGPDSINGIMIDGRLSGGAEL
jgi:cytosine/adenosine deaminase-related metal-dependent hydrolase